MLSMSLLAPHRIHFSTEFYVFENGFCALCRLNGTFTPAKAFPLSKSGSSAVLMPSCPCPANRILFDSASDAYAMPTHALVSCIL